jgi:hypothetical protein
MPRGGSGPQNIARGWGELMVLKIANVVFLTHYVGFWIAGDRFLDGHRHVPAA